MANGIKMALKKNIMKPSAQALSHPRHTRHRRQPQTVIMSSRHQGGRRIEQEGKARRPADKAQGRHRPAGTHPRQVRRHKHQLLNPRRYRKEQPNDEGKEDEPTATNSYYGSSSSYGSSNICNRRQVCVSSLLTQ